MNFYSKIERLQAGLMLLIIESNDPMNSYPLVKNSLDDILINTQSWLWLDSGPDIANKFLENLSSPSMTEKIGKTLERLNIKERAELVQETVCYIKQISDLNYLKDELDSVLRMKRLASSSY